MSNRLTLTDLLNYTTVRIEVETKDGNMASGTGFFFKFNESEKGYQPVIITNKHVVEGAKSGAFYLNPTGNDGLPQSTNKKKLILNSQYEDFEERWRFHPDENVDLCVMGITDVNYLFREKFGSNPFIHYLDSSMVITSAELDKYSTIEDLYMVGYPNSLWDEYNNKPFIRKGITATDMKLDYNGKKEFAVDMACFPGSSGSPILIIHNTLKYDRYGNLFSTFNAIRIAGILHAGPQHFFSSYTKDDELLPIYSKIPNNIGYAIKAERILELEENYPSV